MVAIVSGNTLGLNLGSLASLGSGGQFGNAALGQSGERTYVNIATGNLVLQEMDSALFGVGSMAATVRTYNSLGQFDHDNADGWRGAPYRSVVLQPDGTLLRTDIDGSTNIYDWDADEGAYIARLGASQALDRIALDGSGRYVFTDGTTGRTEAYQGSGSGLILSSSDLNGNELFYTYDPLTNRLQRVENEAGEAVNYVYDGNGNLAQVTTELADGTVVSELSYGYDTSNRLTLVSVTLNQTGDLPPGAESSTTYTTAYTYVGTSTRVATVTQGDGTRLTFGYVLSGGVYKVSSVTDGLGRITRFAYNTTTLTTTVTDALNVASTYRYDASGQLLQVKLGVTAANPNGLTQLAYEYDGSGNVLSVTDGLNQTVSFEYDERGNQTVTTDAVGNVVQRTYNDANQLVAEWVYAADMALPSARTRYIYDAENQLRFAIGAEGGVTEHRYDEATGVRTSTIRYLHERLNSALVTYGADELELDDLVQWAATQDLTRTERTDMAYDHRGQLQDVTTYTQVDALGEGIGAGTTTHYVYSQKGELLQTISPDQGTVTQMIYDGLGRLVSASTHAADGSLDVTTLTQYDDVNGRSTVVLANGLRTVTTYDRAGRVVSVSQDAGGPALGTTRYVYDALGNLAMTEDPTGQRQFFLYDAAGRKVAEVGPTGRLVEYVYDADNRLTRTITYASDRDTTTLVDAAGQPLTQWNANPSRAPAGTDPVTLDELRVYEVEWQEHWYFYDDNDRLTFEVDSHGAVTQTQYDARGRVLSVRELAVMVDTQALADGRRIEMLLGGFESYSWMTMEPVGGWEAGPNAPRILRAYVYGAGNEVPTGTVSIYHHGRLLGSAVLDEYGAAEIVAYNLEAGMHEFLVVYSGDANNIGSTSSTYGYDIPPAQVTTTALTASVASAAAGSTVTLTATIAGGNPTGLVTFYSGNRAIAAAAVVNGVATVEVNNLPMGSQVLTAVYEGDDWNATSTSAGVTQVITRATPVTVETVTTLLASNARTLPGEPVTLVAQVAGANASGNVNFYNGSTLIGTATVVNGLATLTVSNLPVGARSLRARYMGDAANNASYSAYVNTTVLAPVTVGVAGSTTSAALGAPVTLTATVAGTSPTGSVSFFRGGVLLGTATVSGGQASLTLGSLPLGASDITAAYSGDAANAFATSSSTFSVTVVPAETATVLTTSAVAAAGAEVVLTATVSGTGSPAGTVSFYDGATLLGTASVVNGVATLAVTSLPEGTASLSAAFSGSTGNLASTSAAVEQAVMPADYTTTALEVSATSVTYGASVTLTARIGGAGTVGGSVSFYRNGNLLGTATVAGGVATLTTSSLPVGTGEIVASYSGETGHAAGVSAAAEIVVEPITTTLGLTASAATTAYGTPITLTATVGGAGATGTVTFFNARTALGTATIVNGVATLVLEELPVGTLALSAGYSGDEARLGSVAALSHVVTAATTTTTISASDTVAPQGVGVVFTAQVVSATGSRPAGTVTFYDGTTVLGTASVVNGYAAFTLTNVPAGSIVVTASYAGEARHGASASAGVVATFTAAPAASTTVLAASATSVAAGSPITLSATVAGATAGSIVTFVNGMTVLGTAVVDANGLAELVTALNTTGTASIYATFGGDAGKASSVSARVQVTVTAGTVPTPPPAPPATTTTLTASVGSAVRGDPVTLFARVEGGTTGFVPEGTVSFYSGTTLVGSAVLASGQAQITLANLPVGADQLRAVYSGDANGATSTSAVLVENISLAASTTTLTISDNTVLGGSPTILTARIAGNVPPGGTVTFYAGATVLGTATVANGMASRTVTLPAGSMEITARYNGDANHAISTSAAATATVSTVRTATTVALASSASPSPLGETVTLTANVTGAGASGTVSFFNNNTLLGSAVVVNGQAVFNTANLPRGTATLRAVYSGDAATAASGSAAVSEVIANASTSTTLATSSPQSAYGSPVTLTATVDGTGNPTGTVRFYNGATLIGTTTLVGGQATLTLSTLPVGTLNLTAVFAGSTGNVTSTSAAMTQVVTAGASSVTLVTTGPVSQTGAITVQVSGATPTGTVTFLEGDRVVGVAQVVGGLATLTGNTLPVGTHLLTASFGGNLQNGPSVLHFEQVVVPVTTVVTLQPATSYVAQNAPLVLTARVTGSDPTGTVTFFADGVEIGVATVVNGLAALTIATLDDGVTQLTASYSGDANNAAGVSAAVEERVITAPVNVAVGSSPASVAQGDYVDLTAHVTGDHPTGMVAFVCGMVTLGMAEIVDGVATLSVAELNLPAGAQQIVAVYQGDDVNRAAVSQAYALTVTPGMAKTYATRSTYDRKETRILDLDGRVIAVIDGEGYFTEMRYDAGGRLVETRRHLEQVRDFEDERAFENRIAYVRETRNLGHLTNHSEGDDVLRTHFFYDARGQLIGQAEEGGANWDEAIVTENVYDANGRLAQQIRYATVVQFDWSMDARLADIRPGSSLDDAVTTTTYDALGRVATQTNAEGTVTGYTYDTVGRVIATNLAMNTAELRTLTVRYDVQGHLVGELSAEGAALLTGGQTQAEVDAIWAQHGSRHSYDAAGRRTSTTDANGYTPTFFYDQAGRLRYSVNALGEVSERRYDELGRLVANVAHEATLAPELLPTLAGGVLQLPANAAAEAALAALDSEDDSVEFFEYDELNRLTRTTDANGGYETYEYDQFGQIIYRTRYDSDGSRQTSTEYDRRGLAFNEEVSGDSWQSGWASKARHVHYDAFGRVESYTDFQGEHFYNAYDRRGRIVQTEDGEANIRATTYDAFDRVLTQTDANGATTQYAYDRANRTVTLTTPEGISVETVHTRHGQTHIVTDGNGNVTSYSYDRDGNLLETTTPLTSSSAEYDNAGRLLRTVDANGVTVEYGYDAANRLLTRVVDPDGIALEQTYGYDAKGRQVTSTDANGVVTTVGYDLKGQVLTRTIDPDGLNLTTTFTYNEYGDVLTVTSPGGTVTEYRYDALGRRIQETVDPAGLNLSCRYEYDDNDNLVYKEDQNGNATRYFYDDNNRLRYTVDALGTVRENIYDYEGRLVRTILHGNQVEDIGGGGEGEVFALADFEDLQTAVPWWAPEPSPQDIIHDYVRDDDGRVRFEVDGVGGVTEFIRDNNGNVVESIRYAQTISREWDGRYPSVSSSEYDISLRTTYDALNRAVATCDAAGNVTSTAYDGNGNIVRHTVYATKINPGSWNTAAPNPVPDPAHDMVVSTVYDAANRAIFSVDATGALVAQSYDGNGNVVERVAYANELAAGTPLTAEALTNAQAGLADAAHDARVRRTYDAANRLVFSADGTGAVTGQSFDGNGNLVQQVVYATRIGAGASPDSVVASEDDRVSLMAYDAANRMRWSIDAMGGVTEFGYDFVGMVTRRTEYLAQVQQPYAGADTLSLLAQLGSSQPGEADRTTWSAYDQANRLVYSVSPDGAVVESRYDIAGNAIATIAYANRINVTWSGDFTHPDSIEEAIQPQTRDRVTVRAFDKAGRLHYSVDGGGYVTRHDYDGRGLLLASTLYGNPLMGGASPSLSLAGNSAGIASVLPVGAGIDRRDQFIYDASGQLAASIDGLNQDESYERDGLGNKVAFTNKNGDTWTYEYDAAGRLVEETAPGVYLQSTGTTTEIVTRMAYDALGNLLARTEAYGLAEQRTTSYEYDALGRQVKTIFPPVDIYDAASDNLAVNGANGIAARTELQDVQLYTQVTYDVFGNAVANRDVAGNYSYKTYDRLGRVYDEVDAMGYVTTYDRNRFGEVAALHRYSEAAALPAGEATSQQLWDAIGAAVGSSDVRTIEMSYDQLGRKIQVREPSVYVHEVEGYYAARVTGYEYNAFGEVTFVGDSASGEYLAPTTKNYYNRRGELIGVMDAEGYLTTQKYDSAGNVISRTEWANSFKYYAEEDLPLDEVSGGGTGPVDTLYEAYNDIAAGNVNPNGAWTMGWKPYHGSYDFTPFDVNYPGTSAVWTMSGNTDPYYTPYVGADTSGGTMFAHPGPNGEVAVLRWTMPHAGRYAFNFTVHHGGSTTRQVYMGGTTFIAEGSTSGTFESSGDGGTLEFEIGSDGSYWGDGTYFSVTFELLEDWSGQPLPVAAAASSENHPNASIDDRTTLYGYDALNRLTSEVRKNVEHSTAPDGSVLNDHGDGGGVGVLDVGTFEMVDLATYYEYDAVGNLLATTDALGQVTRSEYDALGRVTSVIEPARAAANGAAPRTDYYRNAHGNVLLQVERAAGEAMGNLVTSFEYDSHGHAIRASDALGIQHYMSYDARGNLVKQWQGVAGNDGVTHTLYTAFEYDKLGRQVDVVTPGTNSVISGNNITTINQAAAGVVHNRSVYNAYGEVVQRGTYANGAVQMQEHFEYDAAGRLVRTNAGDGNWKVMLYNLRGFKTAEVTSAGGAGGADLSASSQEEANLGYIGGTRRVDYEVDGLGRATAIHLAARADPSYEGQVSPTVYQSFDRWGNVASQSDARNSSLVTYFRYNGNNQVVEQRRPGVMEETSYYGFWESVTTMRYDALGRLVATIDANGNVNGQVWDEGDNLVRELHADGGVVQYQYDIFDNKIRTTDAEGRSTRYTYDRLHRLTQITGDTVEVSTADGNYNLSTGNAQLSTTYTYDSVGQKLTETNGAGETTAYTYDLRGNVTSTRLPLTQVNKAAFDIYGNQMAAQDPNNALAAWNYDSFGQLQSYMDLAGHVHTMSYDAARQLTRHTSTRGQDIRYAYDDAGQLFQIHDAAIGQLTQYAYDFAGHRTREYMEKGGTTYQNTYLSYDNLGRLAHVSALDGISMYIEYDAVGNKLRQLNYGNGLARSVENTSQVLVGYDEFSGPIYQTQTTYNTVYDASQQEFWYAYDSMNRQTVVDAVDANWNINSAQGHYVEYDRNGNRISDTHWGQQVTKQRVVNYDEAGNPLYSPNPTTPGGGQIVYFDESSTVIERYVNREGLITEYYGYDAMNRLQTVATGGFDYDLNPLPRENAIVLDHRYYDGAGRLVRNGPAGALNADYIKALNEGGTADANGAITRTTRYDANGRVLSQYVQEPDGTRQYEVVYRRSWRETEQQWLPIGYDENTGTIYGWVDVQVTREADGYDAAGNVTGYRVVTNQNTSYYSIATEKFESYKEGTVSGFRSDNPNQSRSTVNHYDVNGNLTSIDDNTGSTAAHRQFVNDANGMVLQKTQQGHVFKQLVIGGQLFATYGVAENEQKPGEYTQQTTFNPNYQPITNGYPSAATGTYTVRAGDSLETIAQAAYGDSQLWYLIADANGLSGNADLRVGQTLNLPLRVGSVHNNSETFKPYDPSEIIGETTPALPAPPKKKGGCGGLGMIIMVIVAVVATIVTAGAAAVALGAAQGGIWAAGTAALSGSLGAAGLAAAAIGGAVGSIASQAVGIAMGVQDEFSWKAVALGALSAGVTAGIGSVATGALAGSGFGATVARAAIGNAVTQGIAVATGLQDKFSWKGVAASAVGSAAGYGMSEALGVTSNGVKTDAFRNASFGEQVLKSAAVGFVAGTGAALARGGKVAVIQVATDAFGNAIGQSLADNAAWSETRDPTSKYYENEMDRASDRAHEARRTWESIAQSDDIQARRMREATAAAATAPDDAAPPTVESQAAQDEMLGKDHVNGLDLQSDNYNNSRRTAVVKKGQGPLAALAGIGLTPEEQRAGYGYLLATGQVKLNKDGVPIVQPGQELHVDLSDTRYADAAGTVIAQESRLRADRADRAAQLATMSNTAATSGMSGDEAYATYMAYGGRNSLANRPAAPVMGEVKNFNAMGEYTGSTWEPVDTTPVRDPVGEAIVRTAKAAWADPGEAAIGVVKSIGNIGPGALNMAIMLPKLAVEGNLAIGNVLGLVSDSTYQNFRDVQPWQMHTWEPTNDAQRFGQYGTDLATLAAGGVSGWRQAGKISELRQLESAASDLSGLARTAEQSTGDLYRLGRPAAPLERTLDHALNPQQYAEDVAAHYGINLRGSGQKISIEIDHALPPGQYGVTREIHGGRLIHLGPDAFIDQPTLANTIAHELSHARDFLRGGAHKPHGDRSSVGGDGSVYGAGNALEEWIRGLR